MAERTQIKPNDTVLNRSTGETKVVAACNYVSKELLLYNDDGEVIWQTVWLFTDCEIVKRGYESKSQPEKLINELLASGMDNFVDTTSAMWHGLL